LICRKGSENDERFISKFEAIENSPSGIQSQPDAAQQEQLKMLRERRLTTQYQTITLC
jgi:hypothetical protein